MAVFPYVFVIVDIALYSIPATETAGHSSPGNIADAGNL